MHKKAGTSLVARVQMCEFSHFRSNFIAQITLFSYKGEKKSAICASLSLKLAIFAVRKLKSKSK